MNYHKLKISCNTINIMVGNVTATKTSSPKLVFVYIVDDDEVPNYIGIENAATCALINYIATRNKQNSALRNKPANSFLRKPAKTANRNAIHRRLELVQQLANDPRSPH